MDLNNSADLFTACSSDDVSTQATAYEVLWAYLFQVAYQMVYLRDMRLHSPLEIVARSIFGARMPATTTVPIHETSPFFPVVDLEIEVVAPLV